MTTLLSSSKSVGYRYIKLTMVVSWALLVCFAHNAGARDAMLEKFDAWEAKMKLKAPTDLMNALKASSIKDGVLYSWAWIGADSSTDKVAANRDFTLEKPGYVQLELENVSDNSQPIIVKVVVWSTERRKYLKSGATLSPDNDWKSSGERHNFSYPVYFMTYDRETAKLTKVVQGETGGKNTRSLFEVSKYSIQ